METKETDLVHIQQMRSLINNLVHQMRANIQQINDPQAKTLLQTSIEVMLGIANAINDYEKKNSKLWQVPSSKEPSGTYEGIL